MPIATSQCPMESPGSPPRPREANLLRSAAPKRLDSPATLHPCSPNLSGSNPRGPILSQQSTRARIRRAPALASVFPFSADGTRDGWQRDMPIDEIALDHAARRVFGLRRSAPLAARRWRKSFRPSRRGSDAVRAERYAAGVRALLGHYTAPLIPTALLGRKSSLASFTVVEARQR